MKKTRTVWGENIHVREGDTGGKEEFVPHKGPMEVPIRAHPARKRRYLKRHGEI